MLQKVLVLFLNWKVFIIIFGCIFTTFFLWNLFCIIFPQRNLQIQPRCLPLITYIYWSPSAATAKGLFPSCIHLRLSSELALLQHLSESELLELDTGFWVDFSTVRKGLTFFPPTSVLPICISKRLWITIFCWKLYALPILRREPVTL